MLRLKERAIVQLHKRALIFDNRAWCSGSEEVAHRYLGSKPNEKTSGGQTRKHAAARQRDHASVALECLPSTAWMRCVVTAQRPPHITLANRNANGDVMRSIPDAKGFHAQLRFRVIVFSVRLVDAQRRTVIDNMITFAHSSTDDDPQP